MKNTTFLPPPFYIKQTGFTLIELMISLVLGLLISAAVVQIYITNARTSTVQKSASELQDASVFGIQLLENHIRLANLGTSKIEITDETIGGGIILSQSNLVTANGYLSHTGGESATVDTPNNWTGVSNTDIHSDQLTLQFTNMTGETIPDCEGADIANGARVVERYFLRNSPATASTKADATGLQNLVLACDAGRVQLNDPIEATSATATTSAVAATSATATVISAMSGVTATDSRYFGQAGQEFIQGVDQFKILLGVQEIAGASKGKLRYISTKDYVSLTGTKPAIVSVKVGLVVHGNTPVFGSDDLTRFNVIGTTNTLKSATDATRKKQVHTTYESTSLLRNARVIQ